MTTTILFGLGATLQIVVSILFIRGQRRINDEHEVKLNLLRDGVIGLLKERDMGRAGLKRIQGLFKQDKRAN